MERLSGSAERQKSASAGRIVFIASLGLAAGVAMTSLPAQAAHAPREVQATKALNAKGTTVAAKDVEETGSIETETADTSNCNRSRKRLFVEGEGWIVRRVTTCY